MLLQSRTHSATSFLVNFFISSPDAIMSALVSCKLLHHYGVVMFTVPCPVIFGAGYQAAPEMEIHEWHVVSVCGLFQRQMLIVSLAQFRRGFLKQLLWQKVLTSK